jgi:peroxiredoxin
MANKRAVLFTCILIAASSFSPAQAEEGAFHRQASFAYNFTLQDLSGNPVSLSSYRGRQPVILFFWTVSCLYCRTGLKKLEALYPQLVKEGWEVLAINAGEPAYRVENFLKKNPFSFKVLLDKDADVSFAYGIFGVPTYAIIDQAGQVSFQDNYFPEKDYQVLR